MSSFLNSFWIDLFDSDSNALQQSIITTNHLTHSYKSASPHSFFNRYDLIVTIVPFFSHCNSSFVAMRNNSNCSETNMVHSRDTLVQIFQYPKPLDLLESFRGEITHRHCVEGMALTGFYLIFGTTNRTGNAMCDYALVHFVCLRQPSSNWKTTTTTEQLAMLFFSGIPVPGLYLSRVPSSTKAV